MKTVVILGAGRGQMPIYDICKRIGCRVVFVTPKGNYPGINKAKVCFADVRDYDKVYEIAQNEKANAIITDQLDAGVFSCAFASEKLGLNGIGTSVAKRFTNKAEMRKCADSAGVAVPGFFTAKSEQDIINLQKKLIFPLIMKPTDNASSRGVHYVDNLDEILFHFSETKSYSSEGIVLLESFVKGTEYVVESYVKDGEILDLIIGKSEYFNLPKLFIPKGRFFRDASIAETYVEQKILETNNKLIRAFGLPFGITHGEYIYNEAEDRVYLVEIAARGGGEFISGDLIPCACGISANEMMVKHSLGIDYEIPCERKKKASAYFSYLLPEGEIISISGIEEIKQIDGVYKPMFDNVAIGMKNGPIRDKASRKGPILVEGETIQECYKIREMVKKLLKIEVRGINGNVSGVIWD